MYCCLFVHYIFISRKFVLIRVQNQVQITTTTNRGAEKVQITLQVRKVHHLRWTSDRSRLSKCQPSLNRALYLQGTPVLNTLLSSNSQSGSNPPSNAAPQFASPVSERNKYRSSITHFPSAFPRTREKYPIAICPLHSHIVQTSPTHYRTI